MKLLSLLLRATALLFLSPLQAEAPPAVTRPVILIIGSYHSTYEWQKGYIEAIQHEMDPRKYDIQVFEMDTKRLPKKDHPAMAEKAWQHYEKTQPALVFLGDDTALDFLGKKFAATKTPVVYLGINTSPRDYLDGNPQNITGVLERPLLRRSILCLKDLIPNLKNVLILFDGDRTAEIVFREHFKGNSTLTLSGITCHIQLVPLSSRWKELVRSAKHRYEAIIVGLYQTVKDDGGNPIPQEELIRWTSVHAPVPIFAFWDFAIGPEKTIGGLILTGTSQGKKAAEIARQILAGQSPADIRPILLEEGIFMFSRTQLKRWSITLPPEVQNQAAFTD